jgi:hypothetical protein
MAYEELRDKTVGEAGEAWKRADAEEQHLRRTYEKLLNDNRYTAEHKAERAERAYEEAAPRIRAGREQARQKLEQQAHSGEVFSIPMPGDAPPAAKDPAELLAAQNEAERIRRQLARRAEGSPLRTAPAATLKEEYRRGMLEGGVEGTAVCRGVLAVCRELGVEVDAVVDEFRRASHRDSLERAQQARLALHALGRAVPAPPAALRSRARMSGSREQRMRRKAEEARRAQAERS